MAKRTFGRGLRPGYKQFLKRQFNKMAEERRRRYQQILPAGSLLDQKNPVVTPIVRYRCTCICGATFLADSMPANCPNYPHLCKNPKITFVVVTDPSVRT